MTAPAEAALFAAIAERARRVVAGWDEAAGLVGAVPPLTPDAYRALGLVERTAVVALLKRTEQLVDLTGRATRVLFATLDVDTAGWFARDYANRLEKAGVVDSAEEWSLVVKLRNRLAHEYPVGEREQLERLNDAFAARALLFGTLDRLQDFAVARGIAP